jgi:RNA polymerase sigma factor (sigma-70 family)
MLYEVRTFPGVRAPYSKFTPDTTTSNSQLFDHDKIPDKVLWESFKSGDEIAFINIYKSYCNMLYNYGCQFTEDKEMVRDCLQDFFIYLRKNKAGFGETNSIKMYLFKAFKRRVIDYLKKNTVEFCSNEEFAFTKFSVELSPESNYINQQIKAEQIERLNKALKALDSKEREAIYYFYYEGLSYEQIAEILNFSHVSSARRVMYRGLHHLRKFF